MRRFAPSGSRHQRVVSRHQDGIAPALAEVEQQVHDLCVCIRVQVAGGIVGE